MTILAISSAATTAFGDTKFNAGFALPGATTGTPMVAGNTGFTFPFATGTMLYFYNVGTTVTLTLVNPNSSALNVTTASLTTATGYLFGPISSTFCNGAGLVQVNVGGTPTLASCYIGVYLLPAYTGTSHNPMDMTVSGVADW